MGKFKTQIDAPLSSKNRSSNLEGSEVSLLGLTIYKLTDQVEGVIALAGSVESEEYCDEDVVGWHILVPILGSVGELL